MSSVSSASDLFESRLKKASVVFALPEIEKRSNLNLSSDLTLSTSFVPSSETSFVANSAEFSISSDLNNCLNVQSSWGSGYDSGGTTGASKNYWVGDYPPFDWYDWWNPWRPCPAVIPAIGTISTTVIPTFGDDEVKRLLREIKDELKGSTNKLPKELVSEQFPPSNVKVYDTGKLVIEVSLAGFEKSEVRVEYHDDYVVVYFSKMTGEEAGTVVYLQKGIKDREGEIKFFVDPKKYDRASTAVTFKGGLLTIGVSPIVESFKTVLTIEGDE
jgi:HSP20 family molecular chaperone IbpA